jgi:hypothetical protein
MWSNFAFTEFSEVELSFRIHRHQRLAAALNHMTLRLLNAYFPKQTGRSRGTKDDKGDAVYLFGLSLFSVKRYARMVPLIVNSGQGQPM